MFDAHGTGTRRSSAIRIGTERFLLQLPQGAVPAVLAPIATAARR